MAEYDDLKLPFHRKYRPNTLSRYVGNEKLKKAAMSALAKSVKPQVILLEGASGCGKTTFARLIAKEYLCDSRDEINGACNSCYYCQLVDEYIATGNTDNLSNINEVNIADQSGKRDLNGILEEMQIPSYGDEWKIYIFDECHMATPQAQNMMLKIVEEPPENVLMIFCTTNPEMMIDTLVNRCQLQLHVSKPTVKDLAGLLKYVCSCEGVDCDVKGLNFIANRSDLTIRQALTNLERVITEQDKATYECAVQVFEEVSDTLIAEFFNKLLPSASGKRDVTGYVTLLHRIKTQTELKMFISNLVDFTRKGIYVINQIQLDGISDGELLTYRNIFGKFTVEQLSNLLVKLNDLSYGDIETKLLILGYKGLVEDLTPIKESSGIQKVSIDSGLEKPLGEISSEQKQATISHKEIDKEKEENFKKIAEELSEDVTTDDIMKIFDGREVRM